MNTGSEYRLTKGFIFAIILHIAILAVLGLADNFRPIESVEKIYDVALMSGSPPAPAAAAPQQQTQPQPQQEQYIPPPVPPQPDDIIDPVRKPLPQPTAAPSSTPAAIPNATAAGTGSGTGTAVSTGTGTGAGDGAGDDNGIYAPAVAPRITKSVQPPYPSAARKKGVEGTVGLAILIDRSGVPETVEVYSSSGSADLDMAAQTTAYKWRFTPGLNTAGRPVRCYVRIPLAFRLRNH